MEDTWDPMESDRDKKTVSTKPPTRAGVKESCNSVDGVEARGCEVMS